MLRSLLFAALLLSCSVWTASAQTASALSETRQVGQRTALGAVLDAEGRIPAGTTGSFGAEGLALRYDQSGAPRFVSSVDEGAWQSGFAYLLPDGAVQEVATSGTDVYIAGTFSSVGGVPGTNRIAHWDGQQWRALGDGLTFSGFTSINAIAVSGSTVYVGGDFTDPNGIDAADFLVAWDGQQWQALGNGLSVTVQALAVSGSDLYVGGWFFGAGGVTGANRIARWDGQQWHALG